MICSFCTSNKCPFNRKVKWELLKYEVRKFTINYTKQITKEKQQQRIMKYLAIELTILEKNLDEDDNLSKYNNIRNELDAICDHIKESIRVRSICNSYEHSKKATKFFLNLERGAQNAIRNLLSMIRKLQTRHIF